MSDEGTLFGDHAVPLAMLIHLSLRSKSLNDGQYKDGFVMAIEEAAAYLDSDADDGDTQMQTLMEQVVGLINGHYGLIQGEKLEILRSKVKKELHIEWKDIQTSEKHTEALQRIQQWCDAYPDDIFLPVGKPDMIRAHDILKSESISLGAIHGQWARFLTGGIKAIADGALSDE